MSSKTITITDAAYARLASEKKPDESFTDVILRLTQKRSLADLHKILPKESVEAWAQAMEENRKLRLARRARRLADRYAEDR